MIDTIDAELETAIRAAVAHALRRRAAVQHQRAADGSGSAGDQFPQVVIRTGEAATATF